MLVVGLTGSVGTGKSTVACMLEDFGAKVFDADKIARQQLWRNSPCYSRIVKMFGSGVLTAGRIDRRKLAGIVFENKKLLKRLEQIVHPQVKKRIFQEVKKGKTNQRNTIVVLDVPLLFEAGWHRDVDVTVVVKASKEQQKKRALKGQKLSLSQFEARVSSQMPLQQKIQLADFVIDNTGTKNNTKSEVKLLWQKLQQIKEKQTRGKKA